MTLKTKISILLAVVLWASAFVGIRAGMREFSPGGLALFRYLTASAVMAMIYARQPKQSAMTARETLLLLLVGIIGIGIYNITLNYGEQTISSGVASFIISQSPILTAIFAVIVLGEEITPLRILGFMISVIGVILITYGQIGKVGWGEGIGFILIATLTGSCYTIMQKPFLKKCSPIQAASYAIWGGTLFLMIYVFKLRSDLQHVSWRAIAIVVYLGVFPAAVAYAAWSYALSKLPAAQAVSYLYFTPFVATMIGWLWLNEVPTMASLFGGVIAVIGVWTVNQSYRRKHPSFGLPKTDNQVNYLSKK